MVQIRSIWQLFSNPNRVVTTPKGYTRARYIKYRRRAVLPGFTVVGRILVRFYGVVPDFILQTNMLRVTAISDSSKTTPDFGHFGPKRTLFEPSWRDTFREGVYVQPYLKSEGSGRVVSHFGIFVKYGLCTWFAHVSFLYPCDTLCAHTVRTWVLF